MPAPRRAARSALSSLLSLVPGCAEFAAPAQIGGRFPLTIRRNGQDPDAHRLSMDHGRPNGPRPVPSVRLSDLATGRVPGKPTPVRVDLIPVKPPLVQDPTVGCAPPPAS